MRKLVFIILLALQTGASMAQAKLTVAVAANMQYTIQELITEYNKTEKRRSM